MKSALSLGLLAILLAVTRAQVEKLTDANFDQKLASNSYSMVDFYSPSCKFSMALSPFYDKAEEQLRASQKPVLVAKVDCTSDATKAICKRYKIRFVPWIVLFHGEKNVTNYNLPNRDEASLVKFVLDGIDSKVPPKQVQDLLLPNVPPPNTCDQGTNQTQPATDQVPGESYVTDLTDATFNDFVRSSPYVVVDYYTPWCSDCKHLKPLYNEAASHLHETTPSIKFAKVDCNQGNQATFLTCGASKLKFYPWVVLYHNGTPVSNYEQENVPNTDAIYDFINKDTNLLGGVINLDDSDFESTISPLPLAAVNFYAPWCFYCKKMGPIYKEVAKDELKTNPSVRLYQVDCSATNPKTRQTCAKNEISFLPTLKIFQSGKFVKEYDGDKTKKDGILGFINDAVSEQATRRSMENKKKEDKNKDDKKDKDSHKKNKTSKDKDSKNDKKPTKKKDKSIDAKAAKILKKVFKKFKKSKKSKHDDDDDDDDDYDDDDSDSKKGDRWRQVMKDIHHMAKDLHKLTKEFRKTMKKQPAVDRLYKAFHKLVKTKDEDEDDY